MHDGEEESLRKWAAEYIGWEYAMDYDIWSNAELAESVRGKFMESPIGSGLRGDPQYVWQRTSFTWLRGGPLQFIKEIRKTVGE